MKNYDETRRQLKERGWRRSDRTVNGIHEEKWCAPPLYGRSLIVPPPVPYWTACTTAGIEPELSKLRYAPRASYKRKKTIQAKHVGDTKKVLEFIVNHCRTTGHLWTTYYDLQEGYPDWDKFPDKVRRAKMASLVKKGFLDGCLCGCRGDFEPQRAAYEFLGQDRTRADIAPGVNTTVDGRSVRDLWWEGTTMCVQFHDDGKVAKFRGAYPTSYSMSAEAKPIEVLGRLDVAEEPFVRITATVKYEPVMEFIPITFVLSCEVPKT